uniref:p6.9 n=1 Tax=Chrysodeixis includens nucleopolyhedrovirus TaxID=1207438 RepID=A0A1C8ZXF5_9ABAC|nr:P6.9 [Chrysodeixis includens nucleopolyhedrovirus]
MKTIVFNTTKWYIVDDHRAGVAPAADNIDAGPAEADVVQAEAGVALAEEDVAPAADNTDVDPEAGVALAEAGVADQDVLAADALPRAVVVIPTDTAEDAIDHDRHRFCCSIDNI